MPRVNALLGATRRRVAAFTLTELLAVTLIIVLLTGLVVGLASYVQTRSARSQVQAQLAVLEAACEAFRSDMDRYPTSSWYRLSTSPAYLYEGHNSALLQQQLVGGGFVNPSGLHIRPFGVGTWNPVCSNALGFGWIRGETVTAILDAWGQPINYYCTYPHNLTNSTQTNYAVCTYPCYANISGVVVVVTCNNPINDSRAIGPQKNLGFDLWSYGPNRRNNEGAVDDLANFQP
jgi:type II secretory pathway pseudopilin PulG